MIIAIFLLIQTYSGVIYFDGKDEQEIEITVWYTDGVKEDFIWVTPSDEGKIYITTKNQLYYKDKDFPAISHRVIRANVIRFYIDPNQDGIRDN